ncbi:MAG: hypothetical protein LBE92_10515 [Chryseobacterium sp.]|jgi:uncharacterized membrane protein|uniref:hypothetical protein n=1 Tax=Chryseobacterium sp. TaxID=1871047 RepID=UPI002823C8FA|nr:hypothetical protein [Chryseobacterium sp.]MDR2236549.1 hypothetical protein [Chryseobacterium sp.]
MNTLPLFPNRFKRIGWLIFIPSLVLGILSLTSIFNFPEITLPVFYNSGFPLSNEDSGLFKNTDIAIFPNLFGVLIIIGGMLTGCSKEKVEDEYISNLRLRSVFWSLITTYALVLILFLTVFGNEFFTVMILIMFLPLVLYIFRFNYVLLKR